MTKLSTRKTLENNRFYIQYFDQSGDKITLLCRNEVSYQKHLKKRKISESNIIYKSKVRPKNLYAVGSLRSISSNVTFGNTTRRGIGGA